MLISLSVNADIDYYFLPHPILLSWWREGFSTYPWMRKNEKTEALLFIQ
jgi:hypothetical protein